MPIDEIGAALATPNQGLEVTAAIVAAHLRGTETKAAHVPEIIRQVYDALTELVEGSGAEEAPRPVVDAPRRQIAEPPADAALPWRETTALRGLRAGTRIGETPRERFRSRYR
ncbi:MucR family transcriptional regulator [Inquilinus sp. Marseille-Q2685]|uniref:MucR family transcriptional regulator n=1 Tax=Inquilinus sp. Marseille-Q2685 TaxID=2866581 RepID=UPI001CE420A1|nr:MucR family transcriptional regulator [Inquilinus sp. Marseille-Q2685]